MKEPAHTITQRYLDSLLEGDRRRALRVLVDSALANEVSVPDLYLHVLQPGQLELGRLWQTDKITIAEEHIGTRISQFVMSYLSRYLPCGPRNGRKVVIGCVEGELHEMGPRMCAEFLEAAGFDVRFFGAGVPTASLIHMLERKTPDLLGLSVTVDANVGRLRAAVLRIHARFGERLPIAIGGQAVNAEPSLAEQLGVLAPGEDAREATRTLLELLAVPLG